jgi:hypothetical protein
MLIIEDFYNVALCLSSALRRDRLLTANPSSGRGSVAIRRSTPGNRVGKHREVACKYSELESEFATVTGGGDTMRL